MKTSDTLKEYKKIIILDISNPILWALSEHWVGLKRLTGMAVLLLKKHLLSEESVKQLERRIHSLLQCGIMVMVIIDLKFVRTTVILKKMYHQYFDI